MIAVVGTLPDMPRKPLPASEKKAPVAARVDPAVLATIAAMARADDRTLSYMVEKALREYAERHGRTKGGGGRKQGA